ncbi:MAG: radical SAM protein [Clostridia bacterium]|nr:radical SAM protein [Clostridia bacterium]
MRRHINIPIFIPHLGCPNQCVFCNQKTISGVREFDISTVKQTIDSTLATTSDEDEVEIAFFGGSFTGIDENLMVDLLKIAYSYIESGQVHSIRCSTRPDYIDSHKLQILKKYGVKVIELGLQSSSDSVLKLTKRGHSFSDEKSAADLIVSSGFSLVGQMMIGLPGSTLELEIETARFIISSGAVAARIYPTVVFRDTELYDMCCIGTYSPIALEEAIERSAKVFSLFLENNINVIRIGLCATENLSSPETYYGGPNHAALGELVINKYYYDKIIEKTNALSVREGEALNIAVARGRLSSVIGQNKNNKILLTKTLGTRLISFSESDEISGFDVSVWKESRENKCT